MSAVTCLALSLPTLMLPSACAQLGLGSAERGEEAEHQEFPPGQIESGARGEVTEAELGEEPGERVTKPVGERREVVPDLVAVDRELDRSALVVAIGFADGGLTRKR